MKLAMWIIRSLPGDFVDEGECVSIGVGMRMFDELHGAADDYVLLSLSLPLGATGLVHTPHFRYYFFLRMQLVLTFPASGNSPLTSGPGSRPLDSQDFALAPTPATTRDGAQLALAEQHPGFILTTTAFAPRRKC